MAIPLRIAVGAAVALLIVSTGFTSAFCPPGDRQRTAVSNKRPNTTMRGRIPAVLAEEKFNPARQPEILGTLAMSSSPDDDKNSNSKPVIGDIAKYVVATLVQYELLGAALKLIDRYSPIKPLPAPLVGVLFCFLSLRSRIASVLDNSRPNREEQGGNATPSDIKRPTWTPPGIAFPFIWLTITALRGVSSALVYQRMGNVLACAPLQAMILHLSIGDTWNTITNVEKRLGVSAVGVLVVWASVWNAIYRYHQVLPLAGKILAPSGVWITIATVLTWTIWSMNDKQPLWPVAGNGKSAKFKFSNLGQLQFNSIGGRGSSSSDD